MSLGDTSGTEGLKVNGRKTFQGVHVLGLEIQDAARDELLDHLDGLSRAPRWSFLVTPNVNHLVRLSREPKLLEAYNRADLKVCDSQLLAKFARHKGHELRVNSGADLVRDLLEDQGFAETQIAVVGPTQDEFDRLAALYPERDLVFLPSANPVMEGSNQWYELIERIEVLVPGIVLVGLSFPRQELLCDALGQRGIARGVGIPCGAAVDFLTGKQTRAPIFVQRLSLEWFYRMFTQPRRLASRYLMDAIRLAGILVRGTILEQQHDK